ncbi:MAG: zinc ribbon domain-containing protein [Xanthomonadales bacterium]|jgi:putative FmdB family regulatory protein|nr:zinc ribbon domain-containing protein [Xanthomonadales bacterium]
MPLYGFECGACGHSFERLQKLADADPTTCPACGAEQVRRQISAPSFRLAGGGWYETDFKKDSDKKRNLAGDSSGSGTSPAATESKPAASADSKPASTGTSG